MQYVIIKYLLRGLIWHPLKLNNTQKSQSEYVLSGKCKTNNKSYLLINRLINFVLSKRNENRKSR